MDLVQIPFYAISVVSAALLVMYILKRKSSTAELYKMFTLVSISVLALFAAFINTGFELPVLFWIISIIFLLIFGLFPKEQTERYRQLLETIFLSCSFIFLFIGTFLITGFNVFSIGVGALLPIIVYLALYFFNIKIAKKDILFISFHSLTAGLFFGQAVYMLAAIPFSIATITLAASAILAFAYIVISAIVNHGKKENLKLSAFLLFYLFQILVAVTIFVI